MENFQLLEWNLHEWPGKVILGIFIAFIGYRLYRFYFRKK